MNKDIGTRVGYKAIYELRNLLKEYIGCIYNQIYMGETFYLSQYQELTDFLDK